MSKKPSGKKRSFRDGDHRDLIKWLKDHGYEITVSGSGHLRVQTDQGVVFLSATPKDYRSVRNQVSTLRRHGVPI